MFFQPTEESIMAATTRPNAINWFEIPARDLDRAARFYETLLGAPLERMTMDDMHMAMFPCDKPGIGGCLVAGAQAPAPVADGTVVYLNAEPSVDAVLAKVEGAGGSIVIPRTDIGSGMGFFAVVKDTEGNRVGLHAMA